MSFQDNKQFKKKNYMRLYKHDRLIGGVRPGDHRTLLIDKVATLKELPNFASWHMNYCGNKMSSIFDSGFSREVGNLNVTMRRAAGLKKDNIGVTGRSIFDLNRLDSNEIDKFYPKIL